jgi:hypothetical protein
MPSEREKTMKQTATFTLHSAHMVRRNDEHIAAEVDGEVALLSLHTGKYYGLNAVGSAIWRRIGSGRRVSDLCGQLVREFDVEPQRCQTETMACLAELARHRLIEVTDA